MWHTSSSLKASALMPWDGRKRRCATASAVCQPAWLIPSALAVEQRRLCHGKRPAVSTRCHHGRGPCAVSHGAGSPRVGDAQQHGLFIAAKTLFWYYPFCYSDTVQFYQQFSGHPRHLDRTRALPGICFSGRSASVPKYRKAHHRSYSRSIDRCNQCSDKFHCLRNLCFFKFCYATAILQSFCKSAGAEPQLNHFLLRHKCHYC